MACVNMTHPIYDAWSALRQRCRNTKHESYRNYGARGIRVDPRWEDFREFASDMLPSWKRGLTIERIDNNGNYTKENCKWATRSEQNSNHRRNKWMIHEGRRQTRTQWAAELGIVYRRFVHLTDEVYSVEYAVAQDKVRKRRIASKKATVNVK